MNPTPLRAEMAVKDINAMRPAQRERLDTMYLAQKTWPLAVWRARYLDHPLLGCLARRLIWRQLRWSEADLVERAPEPVAWSGVVVADLS